MGTGQRHALRPAHLRCAFPSSLKGGPELRFSPSPSRGGPGWGWGASRPANPIRQAPRMRLRTFRSGAGMCGRPIPTQTLPLKGRASMPGSVAVTSDMRTGQRHALRQALRRCAFPSPLKGRAGVALFPPPLQGEGRGGDGVHRVPATRSGKHPSPHASPDLSGGRSDIRKTHPHPNPPLEGEGFNAQAPSLSPRTWRLDRDTRCVQLFDDALFPLPSREGRGCAFPPPLQGEGWGGDGVHRVPATRSGKHRSSHASPDLSGGCLDVRKTHPHPNPPLEGEGFNARLRRCRLGHADLTETCAASSCSAMRFSPPLERGGLQVPAPPYRALEHGIARQSPCRA